MLVWTILHVAYVSQVVFDHVNAAYKNCLLDSVSSETFCHH